MEVYKNSLIRQPADPVQFDTTQGILPYFGQDNNFPLRLAKLVQDSPTASACISTVSDFIEGGGFSEAAISDMIINSQGLRFGDFHSSNSDSAALFEGIAINVKYNRQGRNTEYYLIPFENCRFGKPDSKGVIAKILVNPYFGTSLWDQKYTKEYDTYNPKPEVVQKQMERDGRAYKGQILYIGKPRPLSPYYPRPQYISAENWMAIEASIGIFHKNNIDNAFLQSVMLKIVGDENAPSDHPDDKVYNQTTQTYEVPPQNTKGRRFNIEMQKFAGAEKGGNMMVFWALMKEAFPELQAFPATTNEQLFIALQNITTENITRATKVPSILANIMSGATLGGDGNAIRAAVKLMQQRVTRVHALLERTYKELFAHSETFHKGEVKILHYNPFPEQQTVDPLLWESLPEASKLAWLRKNTEFEIPDDVVATVPRETVPTQAIKKPEFSNILFSTYPEAAKKQCSIARKYRDDRQSECGKPAGWQVNQDLIEGRPISYQQVKRIYNYLKKNRVYKDAVFSDSCESLLFAAWGGMPMFDWATQKVQETEK